MIWSEVRRAVLLAILAALAALVSSSAARAGTIPVFSDFVECGSGGAGCYNQNELYGIAGPSQGDFVQAMPFTAGVTARLATAVLALGDLTSPGFTSNPLTLDLESTSNVTNLPSGIILASLTQQGAIIISPSGALSSGLVTFDYSGAPLQLTQGARYWLVALQTGGTNTGWFWSVNGDSAVTAFNFSGSADPPSWDASTSDNILAAFEVDGTSATTASPEPTSLLLLGTGLLGLALVVRRRAAASVL